jgi:hypothetical protein
MTKLPSFTDLLPTCERCRHWHELTETRDEERHGLCRRFPPIPVMDEEGVTSIYPFTAPDETCGEYGAQQ